MKQKHLPVMIGLAVLLLSGIGAVGYVFGLTTGLHTHASIIREAVSVQETETTLTSQAVMETKPKVSESTRTSATVTETKATEPTPTSMEEIETETTPTSPGKEGIKDRNTPNRGVIINGIGIQWNEMYGVELPFDAKLSAELSSIIVKAFEDNPNKRIGPSEIKKASDELGYKLKRTVVVQTKPAEATWTLDEGRNITQNLQVIKGGYNGIAASVMQNREFSILLIWFYQE